MTAPLILRLPGATWHLELSSSVIVELQNHTQRKWLNRESVGQLFSKDLTSNYVKIELATTIKPKWSTWSRVEFDVCQAMSERERLFAQGWHCIGLWHTHPERFPQPSADDCQLAREHSIAASRHLGGLIFAILGNGNFLDSLRVWIDDGHSLLMMEPME